MSHSERYNFKSRRDESLREPQLHEWTILVSLHVFRDVSTYLKHVQSPRSGKSWPEISAYDRRPWYSVSFSQSRQTKSNIKYTTWFIFTSCLAEPHQKIQSIQINNKCTPTFMMYFSQTILINMFRPIFLTPSGRYYYRNINVQIWWSVSPSLHNNQLTKFVSLYYCNNNIILKMVGITAETCWWEYITNIGVHLMVIYIFWFWLIHGRWNILK